MQLIYTFHGEVFMVLINNIIVILLIVLLPRVLVLLSKKVSILNTLGPVFL